MAFSARRNFWDLPKAEESNPALRILYGTRTFCILMIIMDHRFGTYLSGPMINFDYIEKVKNRARFVFRGFGNKSLLIRNTDHNRFHLMDRKRCFWCRHLIINNFGFIYCVHFKICVASACLLTNISWCALRYSFCVFSYINLGLGIRVNRFHQVILEREN